MTSALITAALTDQSSHHSTDVPQTPADHGSAVPAPAHVIHQPHHTKYDLQTTFQGHGPHVKHHPMFDLQMTSTMLCQLKVMLQLNMLPQEQADLQTTPTTQAHDMTSTLQFDFRRSLHSHIAIL